jgi:hypothetical protein
MATLLLRATVNLPFTTGLPRDVSQNVWHFATESGDGSAVHGYWSENLPRFYNDDLSGGTFPEVSGFISAMVDRPLCFIEWALVDVATGVVSPVLDRQVFTLDPVSGGSTPLPLEVALCMSMSGGTAGDGIPAARQRGRIYIGPLTQLAVQTGGGYPHPSDEIVGSITNAGRSMINIGVTQRAIGGDSSNPDAGDWVVYGRKGPSTAPRDGITTVVVRGYVDNEWDTQRRRGVDPTARTPL